MKENVMASQYREDPRAESDFANVTSSGRVPTLKLLNRVMRTNSGRSAGRLWVSENEQEFVALILNDPGTMGLDFLREHFDELDAIGVLTGAMFDAMTDRQRRDWLLQNAVFHSEDRTRRVKADPKWQNVAMRLGYSGQGFGAAAAKPSEDLGIVWVSCEKRRENIRKLPWKWRLIAYPVHWCLCVWEWWKDNFCDSGDCST
jgi:hypothetical protein